MSQGDEIDVILDGPTWVVVRTVVPGVPPTEVLTWFTDARKLNQWWGDEALIDLHPGGLYEVRWPAMNWTMRGVLVLAAADTLAYSWTWDHEPNQPARTVIVHVESEGNGTVLTVSHGPYRTDSEFLPTETEDRISHRDGWLYFLAQLRATIAKTT